MPIYTNEHSVARASPFEGSVLRMTALYRGAFIQRASLQRIHVRRNGQRLRFVRNDKISAVRVGLQDAGQPGDVVRIERGKRFVHDDKAGVCGHRPGDGEALRLSFGKVVVYADDRVVFFRQRLNDGVHVDPGAKRIEFFFIERTAQTKIVPDRRVQQGSALGHVRDGLAQGGAFKIGQANRAGIGRVQRQHEFHERALAASARADDVVDGFGVQRGVEVLKQRLGVGIGERNVVENERVGAFQ